MVLVTSVLLTAVYAQQERQISQYMFDFVSVMPGAAGSTDMINTHAIYRKQWMGIDGAPEDIVLNFDAPFRLFKADHGVGLSVTQDKLGFNQDIRYQLSYAFQFHVGNGKLGLGISGIGITRSLKPVWYIPDSPFQSKTDGAIPEGNQQKTVFDMGVGLFYKTEELYMGLSSTQLLEQEFVYKEGTGGTGAQAVDKLVRHYYLTAGYDMQLSNPAFDFLPSIFVQSDLTSTKIDVNATLMYNKKFWGGVSYRVGSAFIGMVGLEIFNGVKVGLAYDFDTSALNKYSNGSFEAMIGYSFTMGVEKTPQRYKSIRFL